MKSETNELEMTKNKSRKTELRWDERTGRYCAKLGRKRMPSGNFDGHLFRFNPNERESEQRKNQIQILWDQIVDEEGSDCLWTEHSLKVAKALAEGKVIESNVGED